MASLLNMSGGSLLNKGLPYDAEIEYLESSGTQYIDTMLPAMDSYVVNCDLMARSNDNMCPFGAGVLNPASYNGFWVDTRTNSNYNLSLFYPNRTHYNKTPIGSITKNIKYSLEITLANTIICRINGTAQTLTAASSSFGNNNIVYTMHLFNMIRDGENILGFVGRIYNFSVVNSTTLETLIDFIPVRVGTTGYMYDKVSGQLFGNAGTGAFILGNDI